MGINKGKTLYYILIALTTISIVALTSSLKAATLTVGSNSEVPGERDIPIPINLSSTPSEKACGFNLDLKYDTTRLLFKDVVLGPKAEEAGELLSFSQPQSDIVRVIAAGFNQNAIENGTILNFTFDIHTNAPTGKAELTIIKPSISDPDGKLLSVTTENGEIIVEGNSTDSTTTTSTNTPTTIITTTSTSIQPPLPDTTTTTSTTDMSTTTSINPTSSSTTTSASQLWPLLYDKMWGNKKDRNLLLLRAFRDEVLLNTEVGRDYIFMLYDSSLEIVILLLQDPLSIKQASEVTNELLNSVKSLLYNNEIAISQRTIDDVESLLNQIEPKASPELKSVIKKVRKDIMEEIVFKKLGIAIAE